MKEMRRVAEKEGIEGMRFNIIEHGGMTLKRELQRSNPTATKGCDKEDCLCCAEEKGKGGQCHRENVNYEVVCELCPKERQVKYIGETSKNLYTRMEGHQGRDGFMRKHMEEMHPGQEMKFAPKVTHFNKDCLTRQIREAVLIRHNNNSLNSKTEWHLPALYRINQEIVRE